VKKGASVAVHTTLLQPFRSARCWSISTPPLLLCSSASCDLWTMHRGCPDPSSSQTLLPGSTYEHPHLYLPPPSQAAAGTAPPVPAPRPPLATDRSTPGGLPGVSSSPTMPPPGAPGGGGAAALSRTAPDLWAPPSEVTWASTMQVRGVHAI
jgi:hypothetical protein